MRCGWISSGSRDLGLGVPLSTSEISDLRPQGSSERTRPLPSQSMANSSGRNYYELLNVPRTASPAETKAPYRRLLLSLHPDKSDTSKDHPTRMDVDIGLLKDAFATLFSPESRTKYDSELSSRPNTSSSRGQLAPIVSRGL